MITRYRVTSLLFLGLLLSLSRVIYALTPPVALDDGYVTLSNDNLSVDAPGVLGNDSDSDGDLLSAELVDDSQASGNFLLDPDGAFEYEPATGFVGIDTFTYRAYDGTQYSNDATVTFTVTLGAVDGIYLDQATFLSALGTAGYVAVHEGFEDDGAWGAVRTTIPGGQQSASTITNLGMTWTANNDTGNITTGPGGARSGLWGFFALPHGNYSSAPECLVPGVCTDGWRGTSPQPIVAIGGWIRTNTPFAQIQLTLDDNGLPIDFGDVNVTTSNQFFGVIDLAGFQTFEWRETEGTSEDAKFLFADDFYFAYEAIPTAVATRSAHAETPYSPALIALGLASLLATILAFTRRVYKVAH